LPLLEWNEDAKKLKRNPITKPRTSRQFGDLQPPMCPKMDGAKFGLKIAGARRLSDACRAAVQNLAIPHVTSSHMAVTVSVGVAGVKPCEALTPGDLLEAADASLYVAKRQGRNAVAEHGLGQMAENGAVALAS